MWSLHQICPEETLALSPWWTASASSEPIQEVIHLLSHITDYVNEMTLPSAGCIYSRCTVWQKQLHGSVSNILPEQNGYNSVPVFPFFCRIGILFCCLRCPSVNRYKSFMKNQQILLFLLDDYSYVSHKLGVLPKVLITCQQRRTPATNTSTICN